MPPKTHDAERWRALATEAFEVAGQMDDPQAKSIMLGIATWYLDLAKVAENTWFADRVADDAQARVVPVKYDPNDDD